MAALKPASAGGSLVFVRAVSAWEVVLGLGYLVAAETAIHANRSSQSGHNPWFEVYYPLPWGLSESELLFGARTMAALAVSCGVLLWPPTRLGRVLSTIFLLAIVAWALIRNDVALGTVVCAAFNLWLASFLWRSDAQPLFSTHHEARTAA